MDSKPASFLIAFYCFFLWSTAEASFWQRELQVSIAPGTLDVTQEASNKNFDSAELAKQFNTIDTSIGIRLILDHLNDGYSAEMASLDYRSVNGNNQRVAFLEAQYYRKHRYIPSLKGTLGIRYNKLSSAFENDWFDLVLGVQAAYVITRRSKLEGLVRLSASQYFNTVKGGVAGYFIFRPLHEHGLGAGFRWTESQQDGDTSLSYKAKDWLFFYQVLF